MLETHSKWQIAGHDAGYKGCSVNIIDTNLQHKYYFSNDVISTVPFSVFAH